MSLRTDCREAVNQLLAAGEVFTETDILALASKNAETEWSEAERRIAIRECNQLMGDMFREREVCRYGPVEIPDVDDPDYVRVNAKIAYGHPKRVRQIETPNGTFGQLMLETDPIVRAGRRLGANRNDLVPWDRQEINTIRTVRRSALEADLAAAHGRIEQLEREVTRLRNNRAQAEVAKDKLPVRTASGVVALVSDLIAPLEEQVTELTEQVRELTRSRSA